MLTPVATSAFVMNCAAWSNGGYSIDPSNPDYGTHDWIAEHALDWLPAKEKHYILDNRLLYLYGTELPDNRKAPDGIGDTRLHHIYINSKEDLTDDAGAVRAQTESDNTLDKLKSKDYKNAAKNAGILTHYIADMAVFGHVMASGTDWGNETHHSDYEDEVNGYTSTYDSAFTTFLMFDGKLGEVSAYQAAIDLAYDTTFDINGDLTAVWMDRNYNWSNSTFEQRVGESLNLAVNYIADVLHSLYLKSEKDASPPSQPPPQQPPPPSSPRVSIPLWTVGAAIVTIALIVILALARIQPKRPRGKLVRLS